MAELETDPGEVPERDPLEVEPTGPLLRDPPAPPGYVNPVEESAFLEDPFAWGDDRPAG